MKNLIALIITSLVVSASHAQEQIIEPQQQAKPVNCWPLMYTLEGVKEQGYNVLWQAQNKDDQWQNNQVLFTGTENKWVLLEMNENTACVLGSGDSFILLNNLYDKKEEL